MLDSKVGVLVVLAIVISLIPHDMQYGPQAALIAESFPTRRRYSGAGLGYQLASVFAGGPAPLLATWLLHKYDSSLPIGIYIAACGVVTLIATALLPEPNRANVAREFEQAAATPVPKPVISSAPAGREAALVGDRE
jgi:MFS family permease